MSGKGVQARRFLVRGRVQGVGYRAFAQSEAARLGIAGTARNLADGNVEVYAEGTAQQLSDLSSRLRAGPQWAEVAGVNEEEAAVRGVSGFSVR